MEFLGHVVSGQGIHPNPQKIEVIKQHPAPSNKHELKVFLGLANYYRKFILNFAEVANPLHMLLRKGLEYEWTDACQDAFAFLKEKLISAPILAFPDFSREFQLYTDASGFAVGFVLGQVQEGGDHVISFGGRSLSKCERNYSVGEL